MMRQKGISSRWTRRFWACESGGATVEFVLIVPIFFMFFLMTYESGMVSLRNVMLERGVDIAVREVRIGREADPTQDSLRASICANARIIPDCLNQLQVEMVRKDPRNWVWTAEDSRDKCIDRSVTVQPTVSFTSYANNQLLFVRACARFDPVLPAGRLSLIGNAIRKNTTAAADGSYALVAITAFVVEPFLLDGVETGGTTASAGGGGATDGGNPLDDSNSSVLQ